MLAEHGSDFDIGRQFTALCGRKFVLEFGALFGR